MPRLGTNVPESNTMESRILKCSFEIEYLLVFNQISSIKICSLFFKYGTLKVVEKILGTA